MQVVKKKNLELCGDEEKLPASVSHNISKKKCSCRKSKAAGYDYVHMWLDSLVIQHTYANFKKNGYFSS